MKISQGLDCCGENGIAWHYIPPVQQYVVQYLSYNVKVENVVTVTTANLTNIYNKTETTTYQPQYTKDGKFVTSEQSNFTKKTWIATVHCATVSAEKKRQFNFKEKEKWIILFIIF